MEKTPKFDSALDEYFSKLKFDEKGGQWRTCRFSGEKFYVRTEDIEFYKRIGVPLPTLSPNERRRKRSAAQNSYTLFKKESSWSGKKIVSIYPPPSPFKVFEAKIWYSDVWDAFKYGQEYNPSEFFFKQFYELQLGVPQPALFSDPHNLNSDFTNVSKGLKNCYFTFDQSKGEDLYYHQCCLDDKNCVECWALYYSDTCYECKIGQHLFKCFYCEECRNCLESYFLRDCRNCEYCFMSSNLRNKKYYFRNEYVGKDEYERKIREINFGSYKMSQELKKEFKEMKTKAPRKPTNNEKSVNVFGDYLWNCKNVYFGLWCDDSENLSYSEGTSGVRDSYDVLGSANSELCYEISDVWEENNFASKFSLHIGSCRAVEYSDTCDNCRNCFGCVGISNKEFCAFNKQYNEKEYWELVDAIKTDMLARGEYGEFFPPQYFKFPYRATTVAYYNGFWDFGNAKKYGYDTDEIEKYREDAVQGEIINSSDLPDDIKAVEDSILDKIIHDEKNNKKFRLIRQELDFYRKYSLPIPRENPASRMSSWRKELGLVVNFYVRKCAKCGKEIQTTYAPDAPEKNIWCDKCYNERMY